ncbi:hypothetical protein VCUG_02440 [Vavraia culicis subsp. floridensis]|uniref:Uncharacterized protein n=1 Tax=Vavraia culicis (isolate floridensis) TaxID=948595 RepID=L2GRZ6_VAVCU|nr:uncharacterized protein VCUG_02440 [Vavraia culicis subsp. floridensis]ELA46078.1 hypothetical protein VCUG_02440 [Vavraia culicis subsp. floridensis]
MECKTNRRSGAAVLITFALKEEYWPDIPAQLLTKKEILPDIDMRKQSFYQNCMTTDIDGIPVRWVACGNECMICYFLWHSYLRVASFRAVITAHHRRLVSTATIFLLLAYCSTLRNE